MGKGFAKQKKQAKMMREQIGKLQEQMQQTEVEGTAGNGLVTIRLNGENEMKGITIKPDCVDPEDIEGLQDLIKAAYADANEKLKEMGKGGMPGMPAMPPGFPDISQLTV
jgi:DNA-binding YbaB/EbfC family protein